MDNGVKSATHNLEWAIRAESGDRPIINYNTRLLGRKGVMEVILIVKPDALAETLPTFKELLKDYSFKSGVAPTGTVRFATQRRDTCTTQRVGFATQRRTILPPPREGREGSFLVCTRNCKAVTLTPHSAAAWVI